MFSRMDTRTKKEAKALFRELGPEPFVLLGANLAMISLALLLNWHLVFLFWVLWCQCLAIGFFGWKRILVLQSFTLKWGKKPVDVEKEKRAIGKKFLLTFSLIHTVILILLCLFTRRTPWFVVLSVVAVIPLFVYGQLLSHRNNLKKDLGLSPKIDDVIFLPVFSIISMYLLYFVGLYFSAATLIKLIPFLFLKTLFDLFMDCVLRINWNVPSSDEEPALNVQKKSKKNRNAEAKDDGNHFETKKVPYKPLKQRLKLWFFLGWVCSLVLAVFVVLIVKEVSVQSHKLEGRSLAVDEIRNYVQLEIWDENQLNQEDRIEWCTGTADGSHLGSARSFSGNADHDTFRVLCDGFGPDVYPAHKRSSGQSWEPMNPDDGLEWVIAQWGRWGGKQSVQPVTARGIVIVENFNPGAIVAVDVIDNYYGFDSGNTYQGAMVKTRIWSGKMEPTTGSRLVVMWLEAPMPISVLRIVLDTKRVKGYNSLDTIGLIY